MQVPSTSSIFQSECISLLEVTGILKKNGRGFPDSELLGAARIETVKPRLWIHRIRLCQQTAALYCPQDARAQPSHLTRGKIALLWKITCLHLWPRVHGLYPILMCYWCKDSHQCGYFITWWIRRKNESSNLSLPGLPPHHALWHAHCSWAKRGVKRHSCQKKVNSTNQLSQPHFKSGGNAEDETHPQCSKYRFRGLAR